MMDSATEQNKNIIQWPVYYIVEYMYSKHIIVKNKHTAVFTYIMVFQKKEKKEEKLLSTNKGKDGIVV